MCMVTRHFTLAAGATTADVDALFTWQIPTKVIIGLVSSEAFAGAWQKNHFNYAHIDLDLDCLPALASGLDARPLWPTIPYWSAVACTPVIVCRSVHGWQHAVVLGPDAWRQQRCGLPLLQTSGHHKSQSEIRQALVGDHHTDSLCPVR